MTTRPDLSEDTSGDRLAAPLERLVRSLPAPIAERIDARRGWLAKIRLRVFAVGVAAVLAAFAVVSWAAVPVWGAIGVAVAAVAVAVNTLGSRLSQPTCLACGESLKGQPAGPHGVICGKCGAINTNFGEFTGQTVLVRDDASDDEEPGDEVDGSRRA
ncbi:MAG: hypothetical protein AAGG07_06610 [Planctomycetota bacterium]